MTPSTRRQKTGLELAEERRLAAMTPAQRDRLEAARKKLRARADVLLGDRPLGRHPHNPTTDPEQVARDAEELI